MLVSIALDPECFVIEELNRPEARTGAERILEAVTQGNAVLLAGAVDSFVVSLLDRVMQLDVGLGQEIQLGAAEIAKNRSRFVAIPGWQVTKPEEQRISQLRRIATTMRADIVVTREGLDVEAVADLRGSGIEVCTLSQYRSSQTEARRRTWLEGQRLDKLTTTKSSELLGRAIMYAQEIMILDKMFARAGKDGHASTQLYRFARGVVHVVQAWYVHSPFSAHAGLSVMIVSAAGSSGAGSGFVDPRKAEAAIRAALADVDKKNILGKITIDLRQDSSPAIFNDRFLFGFGRCWSISHGFDDVGNLGDSKARRRPTILAPDCQAYRDVLSDIRLLPKA